MAEKKTHSKNKSAHEKRIAQSAPKSSKEKEAKKAAEEAEKEKQRKKKETAGRGKRIAAVVFAVILIIAFAIPTTALMLSDSDSSDESEELTELDETYDEALDVYFSMVDGDDESTTMYYEYIADLYYDWGYEVMSGEDSIYEYADLFSLSATYYNTFLVSNEDSDATINQAMAYFYSGDTDSGIEVLEARIEEDPEYSVLYSRLGILYAESGDYDTATEYLNQAIELDPDDEDGAKSEAESELSLIEALDEASEELEAEDETEETETEEEDEE